MENEDLYKKDCIRTYSGKYVNVFEPTEDMICIEDIAHALAHQCRFAGHTQTFHSVAEHSIMCADLSIKSDKLQALMHDASEAYLVDIPTPIKNHMTEYKVIENNLMCVIAKKFGFHWPMVDAVKYIDKAVLEYEWKNNVINKTASILPEIAKNSFLLEFKRLTK